MILCLALPSPLRRLFDYLPPDGLELETLQPGMRLRVPFGRREVVGILVEILSHSELSGERLKPAQEILDDQPLLPASLFELCRWTAQYYQHSLGDTFFQALPVLLRQGNALPVREEVYWTSTPGASTLDTRLARSPRQRQALSILQQHPNGVAQGLLDRLQINLSSLRLLQDKGLVAPATRAHQQPQHHGVWLTQAELTLSREQQQAREAVEHAFGSFHPFLLEGVTGSGKTEVYLQLIHAVLEQGKQALVLIPEINLGPQTLDRFQRRFNAHIVLIHSALTDRERLIAWQAAREGEAHIIIGTRSALFTPLKTPGLIIVDEEHDSSYKQQDNLRYHARDLAVVRARMESIPVLLGSATPSLESLHNVEIGRYDLLRLHERAGNARMPAFQLLDIRSLPLDGGISLPLQKAIDDTLQAGNQVLVFINRRGFAPALICHHCGWISQCPRCDARLTVHQHDRSLRCHHCDYSQPLPSACPECAHVDIRPTGAGTERAEERLSRLFPDTPVLRVDRDSTARKEAMRQMLATVETGEPCIMVGTQMLAKGHHFPGVTLVALLNADNGWFSTDFRATEKTAQLIVQVAGRAGRAGQPSRILIQTHLPDNPLLVQLLAHGYPAFAAQELAQRQEAQLPPFSHLALLRAEAHQAGQVEAFLQEARQEVEQIALHLQIPVQLLGPVPALMERRAGRYRFQVLWRAAERSPLHRLLAASLPVLEQMKGHSRVRWSVDVDPIDLY